MECGVKEVKSVKCLVPFLWAQEQTYKIKLTLDIILFAILKILTILFLKTPGILDKIIMRPALLSMTKNKT